MGLRVLRHLQNIVTMVWAVSLKGLWLTGMC